jgi:uncharacterized membrane protein
VKCYFTVHFKNNSVKCYFTVHVRPAGLSPATWAQLGPAQKKTIINKKIKILQKLFQRICDFSVILLLYFGQYRFVFLYCKYTNPVWKYPVFVNKKIFIKKKCFVFMHTANTLTLFLHFFYLKNKYLKFQKCVFAWIS